MLYCPKCQKTYEEGAQRFCTDEGERLLPANSDASADESSGVFTNVLKRQNGVPDDKFSSVPRFSNNNSSFVSKPTFRPLTKSSIFKAETEFELEFELPKSKSKSIFVEPLKPSSEFTKVSSQEISDGEQTVSDNQIEPLVETLRTAENFIGQTLNNRYRITEKIGKDESGGSEFLAEDEMLAGKQVILIVSNVTEDSFADRVFAEERSALLSINHPNLINVIDSGELSDGKSYLVTERVDGETIGDYLKKHGQFNVLRTARLIRQAADALGEAHQNNVLHRNLKPENITLFVDENGLERVKVTNFGAAQEELNEENLLYKSPEQVEGKSVNFVSDNYSLAVIAYQMLTNRLPFSASSVGDLLRVQREGLRLLPSDSRADLPAQIDEIFKKALAFNSSERYAKARDFGDEFFSEIIINASPEIEEDRLERAIDEFAEDAEDTNQVETPTRLEKEPVKNIAPEIVSSNVAKAEVYTPVIRTKETTKQVRATEDLAWEKRSLDLPNQASPRRKLFSVLGVAAVVGGLLGVWYYFINRQNETFAPRAAETFSQSAPATGNLPPTEINSNAASTSEEIEAPPLPRSITQPPNTVYFQNSKDNAQGNALKNFLGFSLYYPNNWKVNQIQADDKGANARTKFLDISKNAPSGTPLEQMLVGYYDSKGTFKTDAEIFPALVKETNQTLKKIVPNYQMISKGEKTVNNGWQAFEVKFQGTGLTAKGEKVTLWGKRLFIPTVIRGMRNGYVITMLATSLSKDVKNIDDVGVTGELSTILETFEPNQNP